MVPSKKKLVQQQLIIAKRVGRLRAYSRQGLRRQVGPVGNFPPQFWQISRGGKLCPPYSTTCPPSFRQLPRIEWAIFHLGCGISVNSIEEADCAPLPHHHSTTCPPSFRQLPTPLSLENQAYTRVPVRLKSWRRRSNARSSDKSNRSCCYNF